MESYIVTGGRPLQGEIHISGAKNAAVAILPATIITNAVSVIDNLPNIYDVNIVLEMMSELGARIERIGPGSVSIDTRPVNRTDVMHEKARSMRGSYYFLGALMARFREASVALPGGCNLGPRPIDQHLKMFGLLGCEVAGEYGSVTIRSDNLHGAHVFFDTVSVGATINAILTAVTADGLTVLENVAKEPHIVDVANFLNSAGADIRGAGTDIIKIRGVKSFRGVHYSVVPDQIEAGTYMVAAGATGGRIRVCDVIPKHLESIFSKLTAVGCSVEEGDDFVTVTAGAQLLPTTVRTMPHPGFPTDMQPQFATMLSVAAGTSVIYENIWDSRFKYTEELAKMGANIHVDGRMAVIAGVSRLYGAEVRCWDLRAGAAMIIAAAMAEGRSVITGIHHVERGYERIVEKLRGVGADITVSGQPE